jgi:excinuclease ABC subunit A
VIEQVRKGGFARVRLDGIVLSLEDDDVRLDKKKKHTIEAVVDRLIAKPGLSQRLTDSVETALRLGAGNAVIAAEGRKDEVLSEHRACHHCGISFPEPSPQLFSFNSPQGMCPECSGLGTRMEMDPALVVPNPELSVNEGAVKPLGAVGEATTWGSDIVRAVARERGDRPQQALEVALRGAAAGDPVRHRRRARQHPAQELVGLGRLQDALRGRDQLDAAPHARDEVRGDAAVLPEVPLLASRARPAAAADPARGARREDRRAHDRRDHGPLGRGRYAFFDSLALEGAEAKIASELLKEIRSRLRFLLDVGLNYLTLDRAAPSLSGGEGQRIRLASQIGSELTGVVYVLDEPSIGLHQRDNRKLLEALKHLRDIGNTVVVVEHDHEAMEEADWLIDFGPGAGRHGGEVVAAGTPEQVKKSKTSLTGRYLRGDLAIEVPAERRQGQRAQPLRPGRAREQPEGSERVVPARALRVRDRECRARARARSSTTSSTPRWRARSTAATAWSARTRRSTGSPRSTR